jgi:hypothetical protein
MEDQATISQLIDLVTAEDIETPDINAQIEIASRIVDNTKDMVIGLREIDRLMTKGKVKRKYFALLLVEICSKNGNIKLHEQLTKKRFLDSFMTLLKIKRGKKGILSKKEKGMNKYYKEKAEIKALYLIQLWADTFMMHQDRFKGVHECYKLLRQEGVDFPDRDPNERLMMENLKGIDSPMFDFIEQTSGKEKPEDLNEIKRKKQVEADNQAIYIIENDDKEDLQAFAENEDFSKYCKDNYDRTELEIAKSTIMILEDMANNSEHINDLRTEVVSDIYTTCKVSRVRIAKIIEVRSFANKLEDLESLLEVLDFIDKKLDAFRIKYKKLKAKEQARAHKQEIKEKEKQEKAENDKKKAKEAPTTKQASSSDDSDDESEESEDDEFDQFNNDNAEGPEIGNIDLLDLGLEDSPEKQEPVAVKKIPKKSKKSKKDKKEKKSKKSKKEKKPKKQSVDEDSKKEVDEDKENNSESTKPIKKLMAPPPGARKINPPPSNANNLLEGNDANGQQSEPKPKPDLMDLLEF